MDPPVHPRLRSTSTGHFLTTQPSRRDPNSKWNTLTARSGEPHCPQATTTDLGEISSPTQAVGGSRLSQAIREADVLVHVESDDPASVAVTSLSVSTKIPEYLVSGRSILAVGPRGLASIDYLEDHRAALVVEPQDPEGLDTAIETLALADEARRELATRGFELASANHQAPKTRQKLWRHLEELVV